MKTVNVAYNLDMIITIQHKEAKQIKINFLTVKRFLTSSYANIFMHQKCKKVHSSGSAHPSKDHIS